MGKRHCEIRAVGSRGTLGSILGYMKGTLLLFTNYIFGLIGSVYLLACVPFIFIHQPIQRYFSQLFLSLYYQLIYVSLPLESPTITYMLFVFVFLYVQRQTTFSLAGCKIVITGNTNKFPVRSLVVMNHRTRFDWLFYWCLADTLACHRYTKVVLKSGLRMLPGFGLLMQLCCFIFLKRNWKSDKNYVEQILTYYRRSASNYQILLFPEGTNLTARTVGFSNKYAEANNATQYTYVLHPKCTGFIFILNHLISSNETQSQLDTVVDLTVGYKGHFLVDEWSLVAGYLPKEIHFHVQQYKTSDLPPSEEEREHWLRELWRLKEERLKEFYEQGYSFGTEASNLYEKSLLKKMLIMLFWCSPLTITYFLWLYCPLLLFLFFLLIPLFLFLQFKYDGVETLIANRYLSSIDRKNL